MYVTQYVLSIRDKKDFNKWSHSPNFSTVAEIFAKYGKWLQDNPNRVIMIGTRRVFIPEQTK